MNSVVNNYRMLTACTIPSHPLAKKWVDSAIGQMIVELNGFSDANTRAAVIRDFATLMRLDPRSPQRLALLLRLLARVGMSPRIYRRNSRGPSVA